MVSSQQFNIVAQRQGVAHGHPQRARRKQSL
jgi:hypothetical protein